MGARDGGAKNPIFKIKSTKKEKYEPKHMKKDDKEEDKKK